MNKIAPTESEPTKAPDGTFQPGTAMNAASTIEISIQCRDLANKDVLSKSDPMCVCYNRPLNTKKWTELLRTEVLQNNLNPDFVTKLQMEYRFEQSQSLRFEVYDIDDADAEVLEAQDSIGFLECTVANIVSAGPKGYIQELQSDEPGAKTGTIILIAEELEALKDQVHLKIGGHGLGSFSNCFIPKTFYCVSRVNDAGTYLVVHRSREIRGSNPIYPPITISGRSLCNGDKDRQLKFEIWKRTWKGEDELFGFCFTTVNRMTAGTDERMQLTGNNGQMISSSLHVLNCVVSPVYTFFDFVQSGTKIHLIFSIDFTSSNGDPSQPTSLHHLSPNPKQTNPYEQAIAATGLIIKDYDDRNLFPVYGFGARIPPIGEVSHLFPITLTENPECNGIDGVVRAYKSCINRVQLFGPTNISPAINKVIELAKDVKPGEHYYILTIITDGVITDTEPSKTAVIEASTLPISIIIVGVGEADFEAMEVLDGDGARLTHNGKVAERDIVQFVEYRSAESWLKRTGESTANALGQNFISIDTGIPGSETVSNRDMTNLLAQGQLAEEILAEIPEQVTGYMKSKGIEPSMIRAEGIPDTTVSGGEKDHGNTCNVTSSNLTDVSNNHVSPVTVALEPNAAAKITTTTTNSTTTATTNAASSVKNSAASAPPVVAPEVLASAADAFKLPSKSKQRWNIIKSVHLGKLKFRKKFAASKHNTVVRK